MEILRMDYRFTAVLILALCLMVLFLKPAYPKNEYPNQQMIDISYKL
tara:strand:- start:221 stop:361 length:141 start_codon:yes stop_codon:yes gene_type:complete